MAHQNTPMGRDFFEVLMMYVEGAPPMIAAAISTGTNWEKTIS
jgi:hypothetical protein